MRSCLAARNTMTTTVCRSYCWWCTHVELASMILVATFIETAGLGAELDRHAHCAQYLITHNRCPRGFCPYFSVRSYLSSVVPFAFLIQTISFQTYLPDSFSFIGVLTACLLFTRKRPGKISLTVQPQSSLVAFLHWDDKPRVSSILPFGLKAGNWYPCHGS